MDEQCLMDAQLDLEQRSLSEGYHRYLKEQETTKVHEGAYATLDGSKIIQGCIPLVAKEIERWLENSKATNSNKKHRAVAVLERFDSETLAFVALNGMWVAMAAGTSLSKALAHIGTTLENECIAQDLEVERGRKVADRIKHQVSRQGSSSNRRKAFRKLAKCVRDNDGEWPADYKFKVAEPLVAAVLKALPDLFELHTITRRASRENVLRLTDEGTRLMISLKEGIAWSAPVHRPMVVKPRPWVHMDTGCYYDEKAARRVRLVRTYDKDQQRRIRQAIREGSMAHVLEAVNAIQETPWAINKPILDVLERCWDDDMPIPGLPASKLLALPERLPQAVYEAMSDFDKKGVRLDIGQKREKNRGIVADRAVMLRDLDTAKELSRYERFYLPHSLDFRGRVYPVCHFSHQRSDAIKALFRFADGEPYGEFGGAWLSVHLANCGDFERVSKRSFDARLEWVASAEERIIAAAKEPLSHVDFWGKADSPFMFLAACFEYADWVASGRDEGFVGHLPVALDGSNSGLQHYSAALRAEREASLVSLTPCDEPADLYQTIADAVAEEVRKDAEAGDPLALLAIDVGITRKLVKRNVMTFAYSSAQFGFRQQIIEDTMRPLNDDVLTGELASNPWDSLRDDGTKDGGWQAAHYLSKKVWAAVTEVVTKATEGMDFFKKVAGVLAREGKPLNWTSPLGLPCTHAYYVWANKVVQLFLYDKKVPVVDAGVLDKVEGESVIRRVEANIRTKPTDKLDKDKARSAVAPNIIHSMDGSHLMLTVLEAKDAGITSLALIHDSFATHAGRTLEFGQLIRRAFVALYENYDPFLEVYEAAKEALDGDPKGLLPLPPTKGSFDLNRVLDADYAFA